MARPSKLTPELAHKIVRMIQDGTYAAQAATANGITEQTYYNWMSRGERALTARQELPPRPEYLKRSKARKAEREEYRKQLAAIRKERLYTEFFEAIKRAEAISEHRAIRLIREAAEPQTKVDKDGNTTTTYNWQAAAWYLERKFPKRWGRKDKLDIESKNETTITQTKSPEEMSDAELDAFLLGAATARGEQ